MKSKKSQQEIIVTVLLVLIALAAVALIATFVINQVRQGSQTAGNKADCLKVSLSIDKAANNQLIVSRGNDDRNITEIKLFKNGVLSPDSNITIPGILETRNTTVNMSVGDKVRINPVVQGYTCENGVEAIVTAA